MTLTELQKNAIKDLAIAYRLFEKEADSARVYSEVLKEVLTDKAKVPVPRMPADDFEWGLLMGIYLVVEHAAIIAQERAFLDLRTGGDNK